VTAAEPGRPQTSKSGILVAVAWVAVGILLGLGTARWMGSDFVPDKDRNSSEMEEAVRSAMTEPRAFERSRTLTHVLSGLEEDNVDGALRGMRTRSEFLDPVDLQVFLSAWARFDAPAAMRAAENWPSKAGREIGMRIVMREWAASGQVIQAGNYYQSLPSPESKSLAAGPLIRGWALSGDIDGALKRARLFWDQGEPIDVVDGFVRGALVSSGSEQLLERAVAMEPNRGGGFERRLMRVTLNLGARENPQAVGAAYASLEGEYPPEWLGGALSVIARPWAETEPESAVGWLLERVDTPERTVALKEVMRRWAVQDLDAAWSWWTAEANREDDGSADPALRTILLPPILRGMARIRPVEASQWVGEIEKPVQRAVLIPRIAYFWAKQDPRDAQEWIDGLELSEALSRTAREAIARGSQDLQRKAAMEGEETNGAALPEASPVETQ